MGNFLRRRAMLKKPIVKDDYVAFTSPSSFSLSIIGTPKLWDGIVEYSQDGQQWSEWNGATTLSSGQLNNENVLFVRGTGNTKITGTTGATDNGAWHFSGSNISIAGTLQNLLDYQGNASPGESAFKSLFGWKSPGNAAIISAAGLYISDPLSIGICEGMFSRCNGLIYPPHFTAQTMYERCYKTVFYDCTALEVLPALPALTLQPNCYETLFAGCSKIKASYTSSDVYENEYRIPIRGTGVNASQATYNIFSRTGGSINNATIALDTIIYTANTVAE